MGVVVDGPYSWVVAVACSLMYIVMYGLGKVSGLLFVATLDFYDTNRETASFPFTLSSTLRCLGGPLGAYLSGRFGISSVIFLGCVLSVMGIGACFLVESIVMVITLWGGVFGLGSSFASCHLPQLNNLYFRKHLLKANGLSFAGASMAGFILSPLVEVMLKEYGIQGTYLLIAGLALNTIPVAMLLKEPPNTLCFREINDETAEDIKEIYRRKVSVDRIVCYPTQTTLQRIIYNSSNSQEEIQYSVSRKYCEQNMRTKEILFVGCSISDNEMNKRNEVPLPNDVVNKIEMKGEDILSYSRTELLDTYTKSEADDTSKYPVSVYIECEKKCSPKISSGKEMSFISESNFQNRDVAPQSEIYYIEFSEKNEMSRSKIKRGNGSLRDFDIFLDIQFLIICLTSSIDNFFLFALPTILNDFSLDKGISLTNSTYLVMTMSIAEVVGKLCSGFLTNAGCWSLANFCSICFMISAVLMAFLVWTSDLTLLFFNLSVMGIISGARTPIFFSLITEYIEPEKHTMANASSDIFSVPFFLLTSSMIGYFRDELGAYDWFVYILCLMSLLCCTLLLALPYIKKKKNRRKLVIFKV